MTAADVNEYFETGNPSYEVVQLECTDGDTYTGVLKYIGTGRN